MIKKKRVKNFILSTILTVSSLLFAAPLQASDTTSSSINLFSNITAAVHTTWGYLSQISLNIRETGLALNDSINLSLNGADSLLEGNAANNESAYGQLYGTPGEVQEPSDLIKSILSQVPQKAQADTKDQPDDLTTYNDLMDKLLVSASDSICFSKSTDDKYKCDRKNDADQVMSAPYFFSDSYGTDKIGSLSSTDVADTFVQLAAEEGVPHTNGIQLNNIKTILAGKKSSSDKTTALKNILDSTSYKTWALKNRRNIALTSIATNALDGIKEERLPIKDADTISWYDPNTKKTVKIKEPSAYQIMEHASVGRLQDPNYYNALKQMSLAGLAREAVIGLTTLNAQVFALNKNIEINNSVSAGNLLASVAMLRNLEEQSSTTSVNKVLSQ